jgi:ABC-type phosphate transport system substrate-binding protein
MISMSQRLSPPRPRFATATRRAALGAACALLFTFTLSAGRREARAESPPRFLVIVHPNNPSAGLTRSLVADLYLKRTTRWDDGEVVRPVDQRADSDTRRAFSESVLKRSVAAVKRYWQQRIFSGRDLPPPELESDDVVVSYVVSHRGAIGYVSASAKLDKAKAVALR